MGQVMSREGRKSSTFPFSQRLYCVGDAVFEVIIIEAFFVDVAVAIEVP